MKINETKKGSVGASGKVGNSSASKKAAKAESSQSNAGSKASVSVSSSNGQISSSLSGEASRRAEKVASIKMDVASGEYDADSQKTADKILQNLTDYSLA